MEDLSIVHASCCLLGSVLVVLSAPWFGLHDFCLFAPYGLADMLTSMLSWLVASAFSICL